MRGAGLGAVSSSSGASSGSGPAAVAGSLLKTRSSTPLPQPAQRAKDRTKTARRFGMTRPM